MASTLTLTLVLVALLVAAWVYLASEEVRRRSARMLRTRRDPQGGAEEGTCDAAAADHPPVGRLRLYGPLAWLKGHRGLKGSVGPALVFASVDGDRASEGRLASDVRKGLVGALVVDGVLVRVGDPSKVRVDLKGCRVSIPIALASAPGASAASGTSGTFKGVQAITVGDDVARIGLHAEDGYYDRATEGEDPAKAVGAFLFGIQRTDG